MNSSALAELGGCRIKAEKGDAQSQFELGLAYALGTDGVDKNPADAIKWFKLAAEQNHARAQAYLGSCYANGYGVPKDYEEAVKWLQKASEQHQAKAQNALGYCYASGQGVPQDKNKGAKWYREAAEQNDAQGQYNLGYAYYYGHGVNQDYSEAFNWLEKAANQNFYPAQYLLGLCFRNGQGVKANYVEAFAWWSLAARSMEEALRGRQELVGQMSPEQIFAGVKRARQLQAATQSSILNKDILELQSLAAGGNSEAQVLLGDRYATGKGVAKNMPVAMKWWIKAAEQKNVKAQFKLGICYAQADGVTQDLEEAVTWFGRAANQNYVPAQYNMGYAYYSGQGVEQDYAQAVQWLRKAADLNYGPAQYLLGLCSYKGLGMEKNVSTAFAWWSLALETEKVAAQSRDSLSETMSPTQIFEGLQLAKKLRKQISTQMAEYELQQMEAVAALDGTNTLVFPANQYVNIEGAGQLNNSDSTW